MIEDQKNNREPDARMSNLKFQIMALIHDNPIRRIVEDPNKLLERAGVRAGLNVLEVGCGPGFFTIPAAKLVGSNGQLVAIDVHPLAIKKVSRKILRADLHNVRLLRANAVQTGLPDDCMDVVLLFGVIHSLDLEAVLPELYRVMKSGAVLAAESHHGVSVSAISRQHLFISVTGTERLHCFRKPYKKTV